MFSLPAELRDACALPQSCVLHGPGSSSMCMLPAERDSERESERERSIEREREREREAEREGERVSE